MSKNKNMKLHFNIAFQHHDYSFFSLPLVFGGGKNSEMDIKFWTNKTKTIPTTRG